jgi:hypothetical protein
MRPCVKKLALFSDVCVVVCIGRGKINITLICMIMIVVDTGMYDNIKQFFFSLGISTKPPRGICGF